MAMEVVNGYVCRNCTDVEYAKKGVDPAHPKDGPQGVFAAEPPGAAADRYGPAFTLGGGLSEAQQPSPSQAVTPVAYAPGANVALTV